jgi:hypothetical protein
LVFFLERERQQREMSEGELAKFEGQKIAMEKQSMPSNNR